MTDVVSLAAELLAIQSTTGSETGVIDYVSRWLVARGWNVTLQEVTRGRANVWASRSGGEKGVAFSTHLDPASLRPFLEDGTISADEYAAAHYAYQRFRADPDAFVLLAGVVATGRRPWLPDSEASTSLAAR